MGNIMQTAEAFLDEQLKGFASEMVEYRPRGVSLWKKVNAVIGKSFFKVDDVNGISTHTRSIDFIIDALELGQEPVKGDAILRNGILYEVYEPNNEPCWRYSGSNHTTYRIHTHSLGNDEYRPLEV